MILFTSDFDQYPELHSTILLLRVQEFLLQNINGLKNLNKLSAPTKLFQLNIVFEVAVTTSLTYYCLLQTSSSATSITSKDDIGRETKYLSRDSWLLAVKPRNLVCSALGTLLKTPRFLGRPTILQDTLNLLIGLMQLMKEVAFIMPKEIETLETLVASINSLSSSGSNEFDSILLLTEFCETIVTARKSAMEIRDIVRKKATFVLSVFQGGLKYLNSESFSVLLTDQLAMKGNHFFLFLCDQFDANDIFKNFKFLVKLMESKKFQGTFYVVEENLKSSKPSLMPSTIGIHHYVDGSVVCCDVYNTLLHAPTNNLIYHEIHSVKTDGSYDNRTLFKMACPLCAGPPIFWRCCHCNILFEYCFDYTLHCNCGFVSSNLKFQCGNYYHKEQVPVGSNSFRRLKPTPQINMLLIGQSGVGKSTWINGIGNYLKYASLKEAIAGDPITLIPMHFTLYDIEEGKQHRVEMGGDENEDSKIGFSATQSCRSYVFYYGGNRICLIDTPGLGDTRGPRQDNFNVKDVLKYLTLVPQIHAVCFLLLPNETRNNISFRYAVQETLCFLHRSVLKNVFFIFTNSRSTSYRVGTTKPILDEIMVKAKGDLEINKKNTFLFDNEAYRLLCALKTTQIKFKASELSMFTESWNKSCVELQRLISHISNVKDPYDSKKSLDVGWVRLKMFSVMGAAIAASKDQSTANLDEAIQRCESKMDLMRTGLKTKQIVVRKQADHPKVVCASKSCVEIRGGTTIFSKTCLSNCNIYSGFDVLSNATIKTTSVLSSGTCTQCSCTWTTHMVINYRQIVTEEEVDNPSILKSINSEKETIKKYMAYKQQVSLQISNDKDQCQKLKSYSKQLAKYLVQHALFLYNDALDGYMEYLIHCAEAKPDKSVLDRMELEDFEKDKEKAKEVSRLMESWQHVEFVGIPRDQLVSREHFVNQFPELEEEPLVNETKRLQHRVTIDL